MTTKAKRRNQFFYLIFVLLTLSSLYLIRAYLGLFFLAIVITIVFDPLYRFFLKNIKKPTLASILTTLILIFLVVIPLIIVVSLAVSQAVTFFNYFQKSMNVDNPLIHYLISNADQISQVSLGQLNLSSLSNSADLIKIIGGSFSSLGSIIFSNIFPLISLSIQAIAQVIFFFIFIIYLFPYRERMFFALKKISPIEPSEHIRFINRFEAITKSTMKSIVLIGFVQGFLGGLMLTILDFPAPLFWGLVMTLASLIPLGSGVVWIPICIFMVLSGQWVQALILFLWGILVISTVDNIIRAKLLSQGNAQLPEILTLLSVLGGINTFGFWGIIYGPAIMGLFYTALIIYSEKRAQT